MLRHGEEKAQDPSTVADFPLRTVSKLITSSKCCFLRQGSCEVQCPTIDFHKKAKKALEGNIACKGSEAKAREASAPSPKNLKGMMLDGSEA